MLNLKDAYSFALEGKHPSFTTWRLRPTGEEKYTNDYIFYDDVKLRYFVKILVSSVTLNFIDHI